MRICDKCKKGDLFYEEITTVERIGFVNGIDLCKTCLAGLSQVVFDFVWPGQYKVRPDGKIDVTPVPGKVLAAYPNPVGEGIVVCDETDGR
jgi:hypothetical protein